ncbi:MAG: acetyl-CoA carboxylase biotin carboxyl carrier protein [Clostridia bacterium]|jgi:acetyl-CoA carboxylase biotin carboxyl carrier protein|nr:acetyl-CoA carboxylase biotin carboxyl carrier protein [bacterium]
MEYKEIKQLMEDMENSSLSSLNISLPDGTKISIQKENNEETKNYTVQSSKTVKIENNEKEEQKIFESKTSNNENRKIVKAPMVGTFYLKPSPTSEAYVEIGKTVKKGDTLCIIEAMKLMNEIESEFDGKIIEICVKDGEAVEYGKPLFVIE